MLPDGRDGVCGISPTAFCVLLQVPYLLRYYYFLEDKIAILALLRIISLQLQLPVLGIQVLGGVGEQKI